MRVGLVLALLAGDEGEGSDTFVERGGCKLGQKDRKLQMPASSDMFRVWCQVCEIDDKMQEVATRDLHPGA